MDTDLDADIRDETILNSVVLETHEHIDNLDCTMSETLPETRADFLKRAPVMQARRRASESIATSLSHHFNTIKSLKAHHQKSFEKQEDPRLRVVGGIKKPGTHHRAAHRLSSQSSDKELGHNSYTFGRSKAADGIKKDPNVMDQSDGSMYLQVPGVKIHEPDDAGRFPLHIMAAKGDINMVKTFIASGADVDCIDGNGSTPLHLAVTGGHLDVVLTLLDAGADGHFVDSFQRTPLDLVLSRLRILKSGRRRASAPLVSSTLAPTPSTTNLSDDLHQMIQILRHFTQKQKLPFKLGRPRSPSDIRRIIRQASPVPRVIPEEPELEDIEDESAQKLVGKSHSASIDSFSDTTASTLLLNQLSTQLQVSTNEGVPESTPDNELQIINQLEELTLQFQHRLTVRQSDKKHHDKII